jgi:hypothetical protein
MEAGFPADDGEREMHDPEVYIVFLTRLAIFDSGRAEGLFGMKDA